MPGREKRIRRNARKPEKERKLARDRAETVERFFVVMPGFMEKLDGMERGRRRTLLGFLSKNKVSLRKIAFLKRHRLKIVDWHNQERSGTDNFEAITRKEQAEYLSQMRLFLRFAKEAEEKGLL
jgi:hypothetical protein